ncbi:hypothetical protein BVIET440_50036 [Burkholderia vietnamiensis]|nr:hypothetical protein BVI1335_2570022 [Burkholderia vietnamiensis]
MPGASADSYTARGFGAALRRTARVGLRCAYQLPIACQISGAVSQ